MKVINHLYLIIFQYSHNKLTMKLIIGTANFKNSYGHSKFKKKDFPKTKKFLRKKNLKYFDTADNYNAYFELKSIVNSKSLIIFKFKLSKEKNLKKKINYIFTFFNLNQIYAILIHDKINIKNAQFKNNLNFLLYLKKKRKIRKLGISIYEKKDLINLKNCFAPDIVQLPINIFNQNFIKSQSIKSLKNNGCEIHARSIFLQGKLLDKNKKHNLIYYNKKYFERLDQFCLENSLSRYSACIQFLLQNKKLINSIVVGISDYQELLEIYNELRNKKNRHIDFSSLKINKMIKLLDPRKW